MPRAAGDRPAGERGIGPHGAGRQEISDPPGVVAFEIDQFDGGIDHLDLKRQRHSRGLHDRRQPRGEHILDRTATAADLDDRLAADQPHRAQIARIDQQTRQPAIDHDPGHGHQRPPCRIAEHDVAVFDGAPPPPRRRAAGHPAVDTGKDRLERAVTEVGEHDHRRCKPGGRREHDQCRQREDATPSPRPRLPLIVGS